MKLLVVALITMLSLSAQAYKDGTYNCKNRDKNIPDNVYKIQTINLAGSVQSPFIEVTLYYRSVAGDNNSPVTNSTLKGVATVAKNAEGAETLMIGALNLWFEGDNFINCRK